MIKINFVYFTLITILFSLVSNVDIKIDKIKKQYQIELFNSKELFLLPENDFNIDQSKFEKDIQFANPFTFKIKNDTKFFNVNVDNQCAFPLICITQKDPTIFRFTKNFKFEFECDYSNFQTDDKIKKTKTYYNIENYQDNIPNSNYYQILQEQNFEHFCMVFCLQYKQENSQKIKLNVNTLEELNYTKETFNVQKNFQNQYFKFSINRQIQPQQILEIDFDTPIYNPNGYVQSSKQVGFLIKQNNQIFQQNSTQISKSIKTSNALVFINMSKETQNYELQIIGKIHQKEQKDQNQNIIEVLLFFLVFFSLVFYVFINLFHKYNKQLQQNISAEKFDNFDQQDFENSNIMSTHRSLESSETSSQQDKQNNDQQQFKNFQLPQKALKNQKFNLYKEQMKKRIREKAKLNMNNQFNSKNQSKKIHKNSIQNENFKSQKNSLIIKMNQSLSINLQKEINMTDCDCEQTGQYMATCSAEGSIIIFKIIKEEEKVIQVIAINEGHRSAIWRVRWADKRFGFILASCGFDKKLKIWEMKKMSMSDTFDQKQIYTHNYDSSVNCIDWAPWLIGKRIACGNSGGQVSVLSYNGSSWKNDSISVSKEPVNTLMWEPCYFQNKNEKKQNYLLAVGGCSGDLLILKYQITDKARENYLDILYRIKAHDDWIRDLSWANNAYMNYWLIATGSEDKQCKIWKLEQEGKDDLQEECQTINTDSPVWRTSWNPTGNLLAIVYTNKEGQNVHKIYSENQKGNWEEINDEKK